MANKSKPPAHVAQAQFAELHGVTRACVTGWKKDGYLVLSETGLVNVEASNAKLNGRPLVNKGGKTKGPAGDGKMAQSQTAGDPLPPGEMTTAEAQRRKESALAKLNELKFAKESGTVIDAEEAQRLWADTCSDIRQRMLAVPARVAARAPHFGRSDIAIIEAEIRAGLIELADAKAG